MGSVIGEMIPLALASVAPVMVGLVVLLIGRPGGLIKASAFVLGKAVAYLILSGIFFWLTNRGSTEGGEDSEQSIYIAGIKLALGVVFLVLGIKTAFSETDPDAPPPKLMTMLDRMNAEMLFLAGIGISFIQIRFVLLVGAGVAIITDGDLATGPTIGSIIILVLILLWTLLLPILAYLLLGERGPSVMASFNGILEKYSKPINVVILVVFGIVMINNGLSRFV